MVFGSTALPPIAVTLAAQIHSEARRADVCESSEGKLSSQRDVEGTRAEAPKALAEAPEEASDDVEASITSSRTSAPRDR